MKHYIRGFVPKATVVKRMLGFINRVDKVVWHPLRDSSADVSSVSPSSEASSDEGLTLETSALESLYDGQTTSSTLLLKQNIRVKHYSQKV